MDMCDDCANFYYDEELECWVCTANLDEDEMYRFMTSKTQNCPYYSSGDEYALARKQ